MDHKKVTLHDIAKQASVSISTVSRVLTGSATVAPAKRDAVLAAATALGYKQNSLPSELLNTQQRVIGIVTQHISNPYYGNIMYGIFEHLGKCGYSYVVVDASWSGPDERQAIRTLRGRLVDGLIVLGGMDDDDVYERLAQEIPLVIVGRRVEGIHEQCLWVDNEQGGYDATRYLLEMGHRKIVHITGPPEQGDAVARLRGYERALRDDGIEVDPKLIVEGAFDEQSGVLAAEMLLTQRANFSAIFAANDLTAQGAMLGLYRRGIRVPQDISVMGFDNQPGSAYLLPPLTTVQQPDYLLGNAAGEHLLNLIEGKPLLSRMFVSELMLRESVARKF